MSVVQKPLCSGSKYSGFCTTLGEKWAHCTHGKRWWDSFDEGDRSCDICGCIWLAKSRFGSGFAYCNECFGIGSLVDQDPESYRYVPALLPEHNGDHLYLALAREVGRVKIGRSKDPEARVAKLSGGCPVDITLAAVCRLHGRVEKTVHRLFEDLRVRGEWFRLNQQLAVVIDSIASGDSASVALVGAGLVDEGTWL